jgi:hypothetical protein
MTTPQHDQSREPVSARTRSTGVLGPLLALALAVVFAIAWAMLAQPTPSIRDAVTIAPLPVPSTTGQGGG